MLYESRDKNDPQGRTKEIIRQDIEQIKAYEDAFDVPMFDVDADGNVSGLPAPYPREVAGVVRSGYRIYELGQNVYKTGIPCLNPILGRNSAEETWKESKDIYKYAEKYGQTIFQFVHSEATRHIDPLKGRELIDQSRGKGGITPKGEREFIQMGGGAKHPVRINATGDTAHINILNGFIAGFDGTDIGPVIHVHFGGRGIHDFRTKVLGGYKACIVCAENKIFAQLDTHKHINNIGGTDGMAIAMCLLSEGIATHAGLPWELSAIQMNVGGVNLYRDLAIMRSFRHNMLSKGLIVVPETFQNPPANLIAEQAHFARMAISAKLGQANYYRPKAAESVGIPTGDSMGQACWATLDVFNRTYNPGIESPIIDEYERVMMDEAYAVLEAVLHLPAHTIKQGTLTEEFWKQWSDEELIDLIVEGGKTGIMDTPRAGGWDLKRFVKTHRDVDGITRYVEGYTPFNVDPSRCPITKEMKHEDVPVEQPPTRPEKIVLATVGADAHVNGINTIRETFQLAGYEVIFLRGMNLPETVAEVAAEAKADAVGVSNLLGLGVTLFPRVSQRLEELGIRDKVVVWSVGRIAEKEEEHAYYEEKIAKEGTGFMGVDAYFGPDSTPEQCLNKITELLEAKKANK